MATRRSADVDAILEDLFLRPPLHGAEIKARLHGLPKDEVRRALLDRLESGEVADHQGELLAEALEIVKLGRFRPRLGRVVLDGGRDDQQRALAHRVLILVDEREARRVAAQADPADMERFASRSLDELIRLILQEDEPGERLRDLLLEAAAGLADAGLADAGLADAGLADAGLADSIVLVVERLRQRSGVTAAEVYGPSLAAGRLAEQAERLVAQMAEEGGEETLPVLELLAESATGDVLRTKAKQAALRVRTALLEREQRGARRIAASGRAWLSGCDGKGAINVFVHLDGTSGPSLTGAVCLRLDGEVRDAIPVPDGSLELLEEMRADFSAFLCTTEVPLPVAARYVQEAVERERAQGRKPPRDARRFVRVLGRIEAEPLPPLAAEPGPPPALERVRQELDRVDLLSWFFDPRDLAECEGVELPLGPEGREGREEWVASVQSALEGSRVLKRVTEMARHEARMRVWENEPEPAAMFSALVVGLESAGAAGSPLVRAMIEQSWERLTAVDDSDLDEVVDGGLPVGNPDVRRVLRSQLHSELEKPTGRDLARLDLAELALRVIESAMDSVPVERDPRAEDRVVAAGRVAEILAEDWLDGEGGPAPLTPQIAEALEQALGVDEAIALPLAGALELFADQFYDMHCDSCRVACLDHPDRPMPREFFSDEHPSAV